MINLLCSFASVMSMIGSVLIAILLFALLIFIHELGHYLAGKMLKFKINEFSLGFGKAIFKKTMSNGEVFSIRLIPLGGYCAFEGEDSESKVNGAFNNQVWWKRLIVVFAGVFFNFISAIIVVVPLLMVGGNALPQITKAPTNINYVSQETLQVGDTIIRVDGTKPRYTNGGADYLMDKLEDKPYTITIDRDGEIVEVEVINTIIEETDDSITYGLDYEYKYVKLGFFQALVTSIPYSFEMAGDCIQIIGQIFTGKTQLRELGGPITTINVIAASTNASLLNLLVLFPVIAINLAVFNFLPFPALDGGRAVFILLEGIRRKPISQKIEGAIHTAGLMLLFGFVIVVEFLQIFIF